MKMKLEEMRRNYGSLARISERKLPVKIGYAISRNLAKLQSEWELTEKTRLNLLEQYAQKDKDGAPIIEGNGYLLEDPEAFNKEFAEYLDEEIEVDIHQVPISELDKLEESRYDALTPAELAALEFIFIAE